MATAIGTDRHVLCKRSKPPPLTADAACIAIDDVTQDRFLCKDQSKQPWLPMVEWLCQYLAKSCGLLVPSAYVVELEADRGRYLYGSKWEGGAEQYSPGIISKVTNPNEFSAIYAFDLLIHNDDRHLNNYLYLQLAGDTVVKAMDHSRCLFHSGWPLPAPPPPATSNTMQAKVTWGSGVPWSGIAATSVLDRWRNIAVRDIQEALDAAPGSWVDANHRDQLLTWWGSSDWTSRTNLVEGCLP